MKLKATILVCTDFDGTMTNADGQTATSTNFYKSIKWIKNESVSDYEERILAALITKFGIFDETTTYQLEDKDTVLLIRPDAISAFKKLLNLNELLNLKEPQDSEKIAYFKDRVKIFIITKNTVPYVRALMRYQGFSEEDLQKIVICQPSRKSSKKEVVASQLSHYLYPFGKQETLPKITKSHVFDDDEEQCNLMVEGILGHPLDNALGFTARQSGVKGCVEHNDNISSYCENVTEFDWLASLSEIKKNLENLPPDEEKAENTSCSTPYDSEEDVESTCLMLQGLGSSGAVYHAPGMEEESKSFPSPVIKPAYFAKAEKVGGTPPSNNSSY